MTERILKNVQINSVLTDITLVDGKISKIGKTDKQGEDKKGEKAYPGLIDIHTHGAHGMSVSNGGHLLELSKYQSSHGVTAWFPTTTTV